MKKLLILLSLFFIVPNLFSQVAINTSGINPDASAMLDISSTSKGVLIPRMTESQRDNIGSPAPGLMIYQSDQSPGFYYYNGTNWNKVGPADFTNGGEANGIDRSLGNTDNYSLSFLTNNSPRIKINNGGNVGIGTLSPLTRLQIDGNFTFSPAGLSSDESRFIGQSIASQTTFDASDGFGGIEVENIDMGGTDDSAQQLHFWTHNQGIDSKRRMTLDTIGRLGLGTTEPKFMIEAVREEEVSSITSTTYRNSGYGAGSFIGQAARGSKDSPLALQEGDFIAAFNARGYGSTGFSSRPRGRLAFTAAQDWTDSEQGSNMVLRTTSINETADQERMRITSQGNVGIGTLSPLTLLQIDGNFTFSPAGLSTDESRFIGQSIASQTTFDASNGFGGMEVENFDRPSDDDSAQQLHFWTHHQGYESTRRMTIDTVGFIGVGTERPDDILETARDGAVSNIISTTYRPSGYGAGSFIGRAARGSKNSPSAVQEGDFLASFNARGYGSTGFSSLPRGRLAFNAAQNWTDSEQGSNMIFETVPFNTTSDLERMRISSQGNVGIGTVGLPDPQHKLHIVQDSTDGNALMVTQNTSMNAVTIDIPDNSSSGHALNVYNHGSGYGLDLVIHHDGTGPGGRFTIDNASNNQPAIYGEHNGVGNVAQILAYNNVNANSALFVSTQGTGAGGEFQINNTLSNAPAVSANTIGTGSAGVFTISSSTNAFSSVYSNTSGIGNAGRFQISNPASDAVALFAKSNGTGPALGGNSNGSGVAGFFNILNNTNTSNALEVKTLGLGSAALFKIDNALSTDSVVVIEGNGSGPSIVADGTIDMAGFKMPTSPTSGHVLTSDASGVGSWQASSFDFSDGGDVAGTDRTLGNTDKYALSLITNNTERIKILYDGGIRLDGNLGIFSDPKAPGINKAIDLYDSGTFSNPYLKISGDNSGYIDLVSRRSATTSGRSYKVGSGGGAADILDRFYIQSSIDGVVFTIRDGGNVGIGIDDPLEKLDVNGNIKSSGIIYGNGSGLTNISANDINGTISASQIDSEIARDTEISSLETDPSVGTSSNNKIPRFNSGGILNAGSITDDGQNVSIGHSSPTSLLDLEASTGHGYKQLRLRTTYTPTSSSDTNGQVGDTAWDDNYFYIKTSSGWKRVALSTF